MNENSIFSFHSLSLSLPANNPEHPRIVPAHGSALQPPGTGFDQCFPFTNISDFPGLSILPPPIYTGRRLDRAPKAVQVPPTRVSGTCLIGFSSPPKGILQSIRSLAALLRHGRARAPRPLPDPDPGPPGGRRPGGQGAGRDRSDNFTKTKSPSPDCSSSSHPTENTLLRPYPSSSTLSPLALPISSFGCFFGVTNPSVVSPSSMILPFQPESFRKKTSFLPP